MRAKNYYPGGDEFSYHLISVVMREYKASLKFLFRSTSIIFVPSLAVFADFPRIVCVPSGETTYI